MPTTDCPDIRSRLEAVEDQILSPRAAHASRTKGRAKPEEESRVRTAYQRDRDRVIHSQAFRRLKHKTQVFMAPLGDHYATRLTHTLEVAQVARTIARALQLNEDLAEAIVLAHDLGHAPFGHAGEAILQKINPEGFTHTEQSYRVVQYLEKDGEGLNLTWEVTDGIRGHSKPREGITASYGHNPSTLEGQIVKFADVIAYINHDIADAVRASIINPESLPKEAVEVLGDRHAARINTMVCDVISTSGDLQSIRMSDRVLAASNALREWMFTRVYTNVEVKSEDGRAEMMLTQLYRHFEQHPEQMPELYRENTRNESLHQRITDYIAGMTDRFAIAIFERLYVPKLWAVM
jgi:dGTPase